MSARRPTDQELFALYHLGVDTSGEYRFRNLQQCAAVLGVSAAELNVWLHEAAIDQETVTRTPFNLSSAHVDAQLAESSTARLEVAARAFVAFQQAKEGDTAQTRQVHLDVDYDEL